MQFGVDYIKLHSQFTKKKVVYVTKLINSQYYVKNTILIDCKGASRNHGAYMFGGKHQIQNEK